VNEDSTAAQTESAQIMAAVIDRQTAGWDVRNAVRNYSTLVAGQAAVALFSLASVWLLTRRLDTDGYGGVVAVIAASQVAQMFVNWTGISLARYGVEEFVESGKITRSFWARTSIFVPNTVIFLLFGSLWLPVLASWLDLPPEAIWLVAAHFVASSAWLHIQQAMQAAKLPRLQGLMLGVERLLIFSALIILIALGRLDGVSAVLCYVAGPLVMTAAGLIAIRRLFSWRFEFRSAMIAKLLRFSIPLIPYSLIGYFSTNYLDAIFISQYLTKSDLGIYSVAFQMNGILMQFPLLAGSLLLPLFVTLQTGGNTERVKTYIEDIIPLLTFIGAMIAVCAALAVTYFVPLVFGQKVDQAVVIFWILISSAVLAIPTLIGFAPYINTISATYFVSVLAFVSSAVNLAGDFLLIPRYGLKGSAWATVLAYGASVLVAIMFGHFGLSLRHRWTMIAFVPVLTASIYASATEDLMTAFMLAFAAAFVILLVWRKAIAEAIRILKDYRAFAAG